ncbi:hypothetical protein BV22DRAFT_927563 [Leucogyrophana mollusca]|uniref:Uncharacterized protein n=1 Tax=Leucogyrophana mollusca TaxID=85980 RepID=A0ACB8AX31_9AGAM|nr:hypothetical protein BV22DRAFT_927563 [Leucogyrophana mollusca]
MTVCLSLFGLLCSSICSAAKRIQRHAPIRPPGYIHLTLKSHRPAEARCFTCHALHIYPMRQVQGAPLDLQY